MTSSCALAVPTSAVADRWVLDGSASTLQVSVRIGLFPTVRGRFTQVSGRVELGAAPAETAVAVGVHTDSLTSGSATVDALFTTAGVIDCVRNPVIWFSSRALRPAPAGRWSLDGRLTTDSGSLDVTLEMTEPELDADGRLTVRAAGRIRSRDAVMLLARPGVDRILGATMGLDLTVVAVPA